MLEEQVGDVICVARHRKGHALAAYFELPECAAPLEREPPATADIAASLGFEWRTLVLAHGPSLFSAGAPFLFVPVRSLDAIGRAAPGIMPWATKDVVDVRLYKK